MSDDHDILSQADKLMRRHRVFVAGSPAPAEPVAQTPAQAVDDLPVLTDRVDLSEVVESVAPAPVEEVPTISIEDQARVMATELLLERLSAQRDAIEKEILVWLDAELPQIVMYVVDGLTDQLVAQITGTMRLELLPKLQLAVEAESQPSRNGSPD
jgi:uncharacterized FlaG/YvyC family protein